MDGRPATPEGKKRWTPFHQKEDFTDRIRNTLEDYNCENWGADAVPQEFLANADDAGATEFALIYDDNEYGASKLLFPGLAEWQGPSLCIFNDAYFKDEDWDSIRRVGTSQKRTDETKIGRFGLGSLTGCASLSFHGAVSKGGLPRVA